MCIQLLKVANKSFLQFTLSLIGLYNLLPCLNRKQYTAKQYTNQLFAPFTAFNRLCSGADPRGISGV